MNQPSEAQMRIFARKIMPELYRMQERWDKRKQSREGAAYHMLNQEDRIRCEL